MFCRVRSYLGQFGLLGFLIFSITGCGSGTPADSYPLLQRMKTLPPDPVCRVAVLPFVSESDYPLAGVISYKVFLSEFAAANNSWVAQEGDVRKIYQEFRLLPGESVTPEQMLIIASRLNAQVLILGNVLEMQENPGSSSGMNPVLGLDVQILDGRTGETLWSTYARRQGVDYKTVMHFGQINSVAGLCQQVSQEIIKLWLKQGFNQCAASS